MLSIYISIIYKVSRTYWVKAISIHGPWGFRGIKAN
nr:MAG TPA: hypothetical protein [Caudoviricetes sp.]